MRTSSLPAWRIRISTRIIFTPPPVEPADEPTVHSSSIHIGAKIGHLLKSSLM